MLIIRINSGSIALVKIRRILDLAKLLARKSHFLLGPRGTGKSFLIREQLQEQVVVIDLLRSEFFLRLSAAPHELEAIIDGAGAPAVIVIDEIQKIPLLLDEVHRLIEERSLRFLLTGSSVRKLKRGQANLLAGRASHAELFPFVWREFENFDLQRYLRFGGLPRVYLSDDPAEELDADVRTYYRLGRIPKNGKPLARQNSISSIPASLIPLREQSIWSETRISSVVASSIFSRWRYAAL